MATSQIGHKFDKAEGDSGVIGRNFNTNTKNHDEWLTPPYIIKALGAFDLDPCSPIHRPWETAFYHYDITQDGLNREWKGRVWLNPPYGKETFKWMEKLSIHKKGVALIFSRTETKGFHEYIWNRAHSIMFFKGRLSFYTVEGIKGGTANAPSCLVSYRFEDTLSISEALYGGKIQGKLVRL